METLTGTVLNRMICGMSRSENDTRKLEKGREFSKLISKVEHSRGREKLKQNLQSIQRTAVRPVQLERSGIDGERRLES